MLVKKVNGFSKRLSMHSDIPDVSIIITKRKIMYKARGTTDCILNGFGKT
jgi:hypothetical protein